MGGAGLCLWVRIASGPAAALGTPPIPQACVPASATRFVPSLSFSKAQTDGGPGRGVCVGGTRRPVQPLTPLPLDLTHGEPSVSSYLWIGFL